jgi:hypothetical protein
MGKREFRPFNQQFVKVADLAYLDGIFVDQVLRRAQDAFSAAGIVKSYLNELVVYFTDPGDPSTGKVKTGAAWLYGERVHVSSEQSFDATGVADEAYAVYIQYAKAQDADPNSSRGGTVVWYADSFVITCQKAELSAPASSLRLASLSWAGGVVVVTLNQQYLTLAAPLADGAVTTAKIAAGAVTSTRIAEGAVTEAKLQTGAVGYYQLAEGVCRDDKIGVVGVGELKMKAGTDYSVLYGEACVKASGTLAPDTQIGETLLVSELEASEYKAAGYFEFPAGEYGPIRRLLVRARYAVPAGAQLTLTLEVWPAAQPDKMVSTSEVLTAVDGETLLELDLATLEVKNPDAGRAIWALKGAALVNTCGIRDLLVVAAR